MIVVRNKLFPFKGFKAMAVWPFIFLRKDSSFTDKDRRHEEIHGRQQLEMLWVFFFLWYLIEWIVRSIQYRSWKVGYYEISLEWEAYVNEGKKGYLEKRKHYAWFHRLKIPVRAGMVAIAALLLTGCKTPQVVHDREVEYRDSIVEKVVLDTILVPVCVTIPSQETSRSTKDSTSTLETDYAISVARVDSNGVLHHSLKNKPQVIEKEVEVVTQHTEREEYHATEEKQNDTKIVEVPRDYTWWDKTRFYALYALIGLLVFLYGKRMLRFVLHLYSGA